MATNENYSLTKEIESWKNGFAFALRADNKKSFMEMIEEINKYVDAINAKGEPFMTESLFIALILEQQKMIKELITKLSKRTN